MLTLNKYLRKLGFDENSFPFKKENKDYYPNEDGFVNAEFYDLKHTLSLLIYPRLCYFREYTQKFGYPANLKSIDEWVEILDKMIEAFKIILTVDMWEVSEQQSKQIDDGLKLFIEYFFDLWT